MRKALGVEPDDQLRRISKVRIMPTEDIGLDGQGDLRSQSRKICSNTSTPEAAASTG